MASAFQCWEAPATSEQVAPLRRRVTGFAREHGLGAARCDDVALAVSEALTNVVLHAYRDAARAGRMTVSVRLRDDGALEVEVGDDGIGLEPNSASPGLGLGIPIMHRLSDSLEMSDRLVRLRFAPSGD